MSQKKGDKITFNLSPSSLNVFFQSPLLFYLKYIEKVPDDTRVPVCYGLSGNIVHDCLEKYAKKELDRDEACRFLASQWSKQNLDFHKDIKNETLKPEDYLIALLKGFSVVDSHENHICEEKISFPLVENEFMKIGIKGIVDLQATEKENDEFVVIDYKTSNSVNKSKDFERQALFYNYLIHKKKNILPKETIFHYLKLGVSKKYSFSKEDLENFETELNRIANTLLEYGTEIRNYPIGKIDDLFNSKKQACKREVQRRTGFRDIKDYIQNKF